MEFTEFIKEFDRMCLYYTRLYDKCARCPMNSSNISQCRKFAFEQPATVQEIVQKWSLDHPERYPTWFEWLEEKNVVKAGKSDSDLMYNDIVEPSLNMFKPIPDYIAEQLKLSKR